MATESLIDADLACGARKKRLKALAKAALDLAEAAAAGQCDYFIASQLALTVRHFSQIVLVPGNYPTLDAVLDFLGMSIQAEVGRAHKPQGSPAKQAVEPVHETKMQSTATGGHGPKE